MRKIVLLIIALFNFMATAMVADKVTQATFTPLKKESTSLEHTLRIQFIANENDHRNKTPQNEYVFRFSPIKQIDQGSAYYDYVQNCIHNGMTSVVDLWPVNAINTKKSFLNKLFARDGSGAQEQELHKELTYLNTLPTFSSALRLFVLDVKDRGKSYKSREEIRAAENTLEEFLIRPREQRQRPIHEEIQKGNISFFIQEGSLKATLINDLFNSEEAAFLENKTEGRIFLCQLCEFIMNGFKRGYLVRINNHTLHPAAYFSLAAKKPEHEQKNPESINLPVEFFTQGLCTLYSGNYEGVYSNKSDYTSALKSLYNTEHLYDKETGITTIIQRTL